MNMNLEKYLGLVHLLPQYEDLAGGDGQLLPLVQGVQVLDARLHLLVGHIGGPEEGHNTIQNIS